MDERGTPKEETFDDLRPLAFSIAYRMLGSVRDAEDVVQEAYLRIHRSAAQGTVVESPRAFLTTVTTRLAVDQLRSARARRETYVGPWLPEPLLTTVAEDPADVAETADSLSMSFLVLLERLSPVERAVFLLREVFDYGYDEIAGIVDRSEVNCRQIFVRARKHIHEGRPRFQATRRQQEALASRFFDAVDKGELGDLVDFLAADVVFYGDGGGRGRGLPAPVFGRDRVGRLLKAFLEGYAAIGARLERAHINGEPGLLAFDAEGALINVFSLDVAGGAIRTFRSVINPDKLGHLGYLLSAMGQREHDEARPSPGEPAST